MPSTQDAPLVQTWLTQSSMSEKGSGQNTDSSLIIELGQCPGAAHISGNPGFAGRRHPKYPGKNF